jgi:pilus assembly protein CpaF
MTGGFAITVLAPDGSERKISVAETGTLTVGRDPSCHVVLPSPAVSRVHLRVESAASGVRVLDQSTNGTALGDERLRASGAALSPDDTLRVGPYYLRITALAAHGAGQIAAPEIRRRIHRSLLDYLDLASLDDADMDADVLRPRVLTALEQIVERFDPELPPSTDKAQLVLEMADEALGLGPLQNLLEDETVTEIMVIDPKTIYVEREGTLHLTPLRFTDDESCRAAIERIVTPLGRRIDESTPLVDARLRDGSRVNAIIPPLATRGPCITIRKFARRPLQMERLVELGSLSEQMAKFLARCVRAKKNLIISGGTGSGKTTLLNVLSTEIPPGERIVTIEDAAELRLNQPHVVSLESKPRNLEGLGGYDIRELVKNALRMRPDRMIVGECRGGEAIDMLQAMNTGHEGSMTTTHANSPAEALKRVETLCMMAGLDLSPRSVREQIAASVHVVVQKTRFSDGTRRLTSITEVGPLGDAGELSLREIFAFHRSGTSPSGKVLGEYRTTGYVPSFLDEFIARDLIGPGEYL